jgi:hypothetical protein
MAIRLHNVQEEIRELSRVVNRPKLGRFIATTNAFSGSEVFFNKTTERAALDYIGDVIEGKADPANIPTSGKEPNPVLFWSAFGKYCDEMAIYTSNDMDRKERYATLKGEELWLRRELGIDKEITDKARMV